MTHACPRISRRSHAVVQPALLPVTCRLGWWQLASRGEPPRQQSSRATINACTEVQALKIVLMAVTWFLAVAAGGGGPAA